MAFHSIWIFGPHKLFLEPVKTVLRHHTMLPGRNGMKSHQNQGKLNTLKPRKMDAMLQIIFSNAFFWMKTFKFCLGFHWSVFLGFELTTSFRYWLGTKQATSHHLSQWLSMLPTHICVTRPQWFNAEFLISLLNELCINYSWTLLMANNYWRNWWLTF